MKVAYLDCASGISGDMTLAALLDAGVPLESVQAAINSLGLAHCQLEVETVHRRGFRALKLHVRHEPDEHARHLSEILQMIERSHLTPRQQELACAMFHKLGAAEAWVHGTSIEKVHFHEIGAIDSIADLVGSAVAFDLLGVERVECSPIPTGNGTIQIAHGQTNVPAPATAELLKGVPLATSDVEAELTTPTGATIAVTIADAFGPLPSMTIDAIGYGAGTRDFADRANVLRILVGEVAGSGIAQTDQVWVLETNIDDTTAEVIGHVTEHLMALGALDAYTTPIHMKKNRPATKLTVLSTRATIAQLESCIFEQTTTIGIRRWPVTRSRLPRESCQVETPWGPVRAKRTTLPDGSHRLTAEFEECCILAHEAKIPVRELLNYVSGMSASSRRPSH
jgi:uncharacterized protein (TIGR00299 family) protein